MKFWICKKRDLAQIVVAALLMAACIAGVSLTHAAKVFSNESTRSMPIYCVDTQEKAVAVSFDASWGAEQIPAIIKALDDYDARASFFVTGAWAEKYPDELKALAESGRVEIGTLGSTYVNMPKLSVRQMELELTTSVAVIENATAQKVELFRAPLGAYSDRLLQTAGKLGLYPVQGDIDMLDAEEIPVYNAVERVTNGVKPGSIVLARSDSQKTAESFPVIIQGLKNKGYSFKTIGELIYKDQYTIDQTGKQIRR